MTEPQFHCMYNAFMRKLGYISIINYGTMTRETDIFTFKS